MDVNSKDYIINAPVKLERNKRNLTALTWAHAVNSQKLLTEALKGIKSLL